MPRNLKIPNCIHEVIWYGCQLSVWQSFLRQCNENSLTIHKFTTKKQKYNHSVYKSFQATSPRWEPQIATLCEAGQQYHPQHLSEDGRWATDLSIKTPATTCLRDKMDLLEHCKKVSVEVRWPIGTNTNPPTCYELIFHARQESPFPMVYLTFFCSLRN